MKITKKAKCPECLSLNSIFIGEIPRSYHFAGSTLEVPIDTGELYKCKECHLHWREPRLTKAQLNRLYEKGNMSVWHVRNDDRLDWKIANQILGSNLSGASILDVGCSDGRFLNQLKGDITRYGIELNTQAAEIAYKSGVNVIGNDFAILNDISENFDIVVAMDVIEHVERPYEFLKSIVKVTKPGGIILISTGDTDAWSWKLMGGMYWYCHNAEHISFINADWCSSASISLGLGVQQLTRFSHERLQLGNYLVQISSNILYSFAPTLALKLRNLYSFLNKRNYRPTDATPPQWRMAKDHMLIVFRKLK